MIYRCLDYIINVYYILGTLLNELKKSDDHLAESLIKVAESIHKLAEAIAESNMIFKEHVSSQYEIILELLQKRTN